jgi:hypothetical protein
MQPYFEPTSKQYSYQTPPMQFSIDCSVLPLVIYSYQLHGLIIHQQLFKITRTWCRSLHVARMKALPPDLALENIEFSLFPYISRGYSIHERSVLTLVKHECLFVKLIKIINIFETMDVTFDNQNWRRQTVN